MNTALASIATGLPESRVKQLKRSVDVMAWLAAKPVQERNDYIWDALASAHHSLSDPEMFEHFRQIVGSQWGQRALQWLERVAEQDIEDKRTPWSEK